MKAQNCLQLLLSYGVGVTSCADKRTAMLIRVKQRSHKNSGLANHITPEVNKVVCSTIAILYSIQQERPTPETSQICEQFISYVADFVMTDRRVSPVQI